MKTILFFWLLFFKTTFIFSQYAYKKSVDSLYVLIKNEEADIIKITHYKALCDIYCEYDLKEFKKCNQVLLGLVKKANSTKGFGFYYCNLGKLTAYTNLKEAIIYAETGKQLFYKIKDWDNYIYASSLTANHLNADGQYDKGINYLTNDLSIALKEDSEYLSDLYYVLSKLHRSKGDNAKAIDYAKKAINCKIPLKKKYLIYHGIANIYIDRGNFGKALEYNSLDMKYAKSSESKFSAIWRRADIFIKTGRTREALPLLLNCLKYYQEQKSTLDIIDTQFLLSHAYFDLGKYNKANYYMDEVLIDLPSGKDAIINYYSLKAAICLALDDIEKASSYTDKTLNLLNNDASTATKIEAYATKIALEKRLGNYKIALFYHEQIDKITKAKYQEDKIKNIHILEADLGVTEKINRIKNLQIEQLKKQMEITSKNNYISYISLALLAALLSILFYKKSYKTIKKKNFIIEEEKLHAKKSLAEKETLLKEIHHRVKNNLQLVMSLLNIQAQKTDQNVEGFLAVSKSRILSLALIHENLYQSENVNAVNFKDYTQNLTQTIITAYDKINSNVDLKIEIDEVYFDIQTAIPLGLIINELVNNAYKHAFVNKPNAIITLTLIQKEANYELLISDNGVGILKKSNAKKTLGLQLVKELVFQIDGLLKIKNTNGMQYIIAFQNTKSL